MRLPEDKGLTDHNPDERSYFIENDNGRYKKNKSEFGDVLEAIWECLKQFSACKKKKKKGIKEDWEKRGNS